MNIFVVDENPVQAAKLLPDKHVVKMILESTQMLSVVFSSHYWNIGPVYKVDGTPYKTERGAFKNHPCTKWVAEDKDHCDWLFAHAFGLCNEFEYRFEHQHGSRQSLVKAYSLFVKSVRSPANYSRVTKFARAMPDDLKYNTKLTDVEAYRQYLNTKEWIRDNYVKDPSRKPSWII